MEFVIRGGRIKLIDSQNMKKMSDAAEEAFRRECFAGDLEIGRSGKGSQSSTQSLQPRPEQLMRVTEEVEIQEWNANIILTSRVFQ